MENELEEVEKGLIRIEGHFCGVATTSSHRPLISKSFKEMLGLELAIPIFEEAPKKPFRAFKKPFQA